MGKELLLNAIQGNKVKRIPWVPFVGCHGAHLIDTDASTYLKSGKKMAEGVLEAIKQYKPDGIPVNFDLSVEAEALGCSLEWADDNPPAVSSHILDDHSLSDLKDLDPNAGRIPEVLKALEILKEKAGDVALYGLLTGPFTLALHLRGTNVFMDMFDNPDEVKNLLEYCTNIATQMADLYIENGCDVISMVDPMTSQISPDAFREYVSPYASRFFQHVKDSGVYASFFVCGDAQKNVEAMCETGPNNISVDENIPLDYVKEVCSRFNISFGGNLQLTVVLLMGSEDDVRRNTIECMDTGGDTGFILAPGCDLPFSVPPKNLKLVTDIVYDSYQQDVARELLQKKKDVEPTINLADYGKSEQVIIDVITLDSESCPPCQYMVEAVRAVAPHFGELISWQEHKIKEKQSVEFMMGLMVKNIPTICIDGKIKFVSKIPSREELIRAIQDRINAKFSLKLRERRGRLLVLGNKEDEAFQELWERVRQATLELGSAAELVQVTDAQEIRDYGVAATPAVISVREQVKAAGRTPTVEVIKEWLKNLR